MNIMIRGSFFAEGIQMIGLTAIVTILLSASLSTGIQTLYAQFQAPSEQEPLGAGEQQVESDGGLTATLNGETFRRGDTIIIGCQIPATAYNSVSKL